MFACQTCLGYESEINLIQVCDQKRKPFPLQSRLWLAIFGHINTTFMGVKDDVFFCLRSNGEDCTGEMV